jgi:hypothetical protein
MAVTASFKGPSLLPLVKEVAKVQAIFKTPRPLLKLWGSVILREVHDNFRKGGNPTWVPLAPGTIAGRRQGPGTISKGKRKKGSRGVQPLRDTGAMERGWSVSNTQLEDKKINIYNPDPKAVFHEFGTKGPYPITPKNAKVLALPAIQQDAQGNIKGQFSLAGLAKSRQVGKRSYVYQPPTRGGFLGFGSKAVNSKRYAGRVGKRVAAYKVIDFRPEVSHPGVPARPVLPDPQQISPKLKVAANRFFAVQLFDRLAKTTKRLPKMGTP